MSYAHTPVPLSNDGIPRPTLSLYPAPTYPAQHAQPDWVAVATHCEVPDPGDAEYQLWLSVLRGRALRGTRNNPNFEVLQFAILVPPSEADTWPSWMEVIFVRP